MKFKHLQHLFQRSGFGLIPNEFVKLQKKSKKQVVNNLFEASKTISSLKVVSHNDFKLLKNYKKVVYLTSISRDRAVGSSSGS